MEEYMVWEKSILSDYDRGVLIGLLIGEGHFGGDGRQAQITIKMHVRHKRIFDWLVDLFPHSKLYGPYTHDNRTYYQWMMRGKALRRDMVPILDKSPWWQIDEHSYERYVTMKQRYHLGIEYADE
jgi:hypothetical protein